MDELTEKLEDEGVAETPSTKKRKGKEDASVSLSSDEILVSQIKSCATLLEILQLQPISNIKSCKLLIAPLFQILELANTLNSSLQAPIEHIKQIVFELLLDLCEDKTLLKKDANAFNTELIVQIIKSSSSPQTHNQVGHKSCHFFQIY